MDSSQWLAKNEHDIALDPRGKLPGQDFSEPRYPYQTSIGEFFQSARQKICKDLRTFQEKFGGHGYKYVIKYIRDRMVLKGISKENVRKIFVDNPATAIPFWLVNITY